MAEVSDQYDPFRDARNSKGVQRCPFQGEAIPMILRHADVRKAARDWQTFSSDVPFRVPIPSEEDLRTMRQLPIERNPPEHTEYRAIVEPFFQRSKLPDVIAKVDALVASKLTESLQRDSVEIVNDFALPIQSHALTYLLNVSETEAATWIEWGIHVFKSEGELNSEHTLEVYLSEQFDKAEADPGDDFFSALTKATYRGRPLSREEMMGFANLAFAGGRDTIIHSISSIVAYMAENPEALEFLRENPKRIVLASEEFFRVFMPLTHIGRVCPVKTDVLGETVEAHDRVSLGWASANFDESVFDSPQEVRLDRKPNPHISFGFGTHLCLGAPHARLIIRTLLQQMVDCVKAINVLEAQPHIENTAAYSRRNGYDRLQVQIAGR